MLTRRETEVASLIAEGLTNREIAGRLGMAQRTAESHVESILTKLGFGSRTQIAVWALTHLPADSSAFASDLRVPLTRPIEVRAVPTGAVVRDRLRERLAEVDSAPNHLVALEASVARLGRSWNSPPQFGDLMTELANAQALLGLELTGPQLRRCYRALAMLAGLLGGFSNLAGNLNDWTAWYETARMAAARADDQSLTAWTHAFEGWGWLYLGQVPRALSQAERALSLSGPASSARSWALCVQAESLAILDRPREALRVLAELQRQPLSPTSSLFGFPEWEKAMLTAGVNAFAGRSGEASDALTSTRQLFPGSVGTAFTGCYETMALIRTGELEEACRVGRHALLQLPDPHRSGAVMHRLNWSLTRIPRRHQTLSCVRELRTLTRSS